MPSALDARVVELAAIHHGSLLTLALPNADASAGIMHNPAQMLDLSVDHGNQLFVTDLATPLPAFRQWHERPHHRASAASAL
jgi:hypothetical protein